MSTHPLMQIEDYTLNPQWPLISEQQEGVRFCLSRKVGIIDFQTGLGKTLTAMTIAGHIMKYRSDYRTVVLCPAEANTAFHRELTNKLNVPYCLYEASRVTGNPSTALVHIFNFSSMHKYVSNIQKLSDQYKIAGFIDEAHALQHRGTEQYKIFCMLRPCFHVLYAMTATPLMAVHNLKGMYNLIDYLAPKSIGSWTWFRNNLLKYHMEKIKVSGGREILQEVITGVSDMPTMKKIVDKFMIVRALKYDIQYHYHQVELSTEEWDMYKKAGKAALDGDDRAGNKKNHFASRLHDLQQVADWSHPLVPEEFRKRLSSKDKKMVELVRELTEQGLSTLIYTEYHATADRISAVIDKCVQLGFLKVSNVFRITGKESKKDRAKVEDALEPGSVVICTRAGTQSRNLQKANQVIVYNIPFSIGVLIQLIGRVARMDTKFTSQDVHIIEAKGTIDTYKRILVQDAAYIYNELFGENSNLPDIEQLDRDRLRELRNSLLWGFKTKKVKKG